MRRTVTSPHRWCWLCGMVLGRCGSSWSTQGRTACEALLESEGLDWDDGLGVWLAYPHE